MAQLQSTCVIGTLAISASHANAQQAIMIGGASNNAEFTNQCNLIAIGENTALSGSGALNPATLTVTQEGSGFNVNYSYYAINQQGCQKPVVLTGGGGGTGASFKPYLQRYTSYYSGRSCGDVNSVLVLDIGSGYTSTVTGTVCDPTTGTEVCEIFTIEPFTNENTINIGHNAGCRAQGSNTIRIGSCAAKGNLTNGYCYQQDSIAIGANTMLSGSYENSIAIGHNALKGCNTCTNGFRCMIDNTVIGSNSLPNSVCRQLCTTVVGACNYTSGSNSCGNTAIGYKNAECVCNMGTINTIIGYSNATTTGTNKSMGNCNVVVGCLNMICSTFGSSNVALGNFNMSFGCINSANYNIAIGFGNMRCLTTGDINTTLGYYSGYYNTTGAYNVYMGVYAGYKNCTGGRSIFIGCAAGCGMGDQNDSIFIGSKTGAYGNSTQGGHIVLGIDALRNNCAGYFNTVIGYAALCVGGQTSTSCAINGGCNIAIGPFAGQCVKGASDNNIFIGQRSGPNTCTAVTRKFYLGMDAGNCLMEGCLLAGSLSLGVCGTFSKTAGSFQISHPDPTKTQTKDLWHSFVESPTAGDNLYRFEVEVINGSATIELPDYYKHLNEKDQVWVNAKNHFGRAYGVVNQTQTILTVFGEKDGEYNVLLIGTRKDKDAVQSWKGTERLKKQD